MKLTPFDNKAFFWGTAVFLYMAVSLCLSTAPRYLIIPTATGISLLTIIIYYLKGIYDNHTNQPPW